MSQQEVVKSEIGVNPNSHEDGMARSSGTENSGKGEMPVVFTRNAARRVAQLCAQEKKSNMRLRLSVQGGGCSGFSYRFGLDEKKAGDDTIVETDGVGLVIDAVSLPFLKGATVDYVEELIGSSFKVKNPNATAACGCGTSFSVL